MFLRGCEYEKNSEMWEGQLKGILVALQGFKGVDFQVTLLYVQNMNEAIQITR